MGNRFQDADKMCFVVRNAVMRIRQIIRTECQKLKLPLTDELKQDTDKQGLMDFKKK